MRRIDCYGNATESETFERHLRPEPLETKQIGEVTYMRFSEGEGNCVVHRLCVEADGMVSETWAWGPWNEVETLEYMPLTQTKEMWI